MGVSRVPGIGRALIFFGIACLAGGLLQAAQAADVIRVGKAVPFAWTFTPMEVGAEAGIWAKNGLEPQVTSFAGDAKMQQALAANSIDFALGSGPALGFMVKGVPAKGVAAFAGAPYSIGLLVRPDSPIKSIADLKGKKVAVTTVGSLTDWLLKRIALSQGWEPKDIIAVPLGGMEPFRAGLKTGQVDGLMFATEVNYAMEEAKEGRILVNAGQFAPHFHTHIIYARDEVIEKQPALVQRFLKGWFETIAFMKANKDKTVEVTSRVLKQNKNVMSRTYDEEIEMMSDDGAFDPQAVEVLKQSFVEMGILDVPPKDEAMFTTKFVPVKP